MVTHFLAEMVMAGLKKSVRKHASSNADGLSGGIGIGICILPLVIAPLFGAFAYGAIRDPDFEDRIAGYVVLTLTLGLLILFLHYVTYRVEGTTEWIRTRSVVARPKVIHLLEPYTLSYKDDALLIQQRRTCIKISWIINGHQDFRDLVWNIRERARGNG